MILYKYMSFEAAKSVLKSNSLGFAKPNTFNDPFELEAGYPIEGGNPLQSMLSGIANWGKRFIWADTSGVLSLTRNPLNPLMWAQLGKRMKLLNTHENQGPFILGNYPKATVTFACIDKSTN